MALVAARCTQCNGEIEVDNTKEAGICRYCGTAFITEKAINNYNTYVTHNNNFAGAVININSRDCSKYVELADSAFKGNNWSECYRYASLALEIDPASCEAWKFKMMGAMMTSVTKDLKIMEILTCAENAIKHADEEHQQQMQKDIYFLVLTHELNLLNFVSTTLANTANVEAWKRANVSYGEIAHCDSNISKIYTDVVAAVMKFHSFVPIWEIRHDIQSQRLAINILEQYIISNNLYVQRLSLYYSRITKAFFEQQTDNVEFIKQGIVENNLDTVTVKLKKKASGCYIATCVYSSYDCPEVWVLRRYRDDVLDTTWYGKAFIKCYYAISPRLVSWCSGSRLFKALWRKCLDNKILKLKKQGLKDTPYIDKC